MSRRSRGSPRVVAVLPRGEAIRNFVYTGALQKVAETCPTTICTVKPNDEIWTLINREFGEVYPLEDIPERWLTNVVRENLDMAHGRWLWCEAARHRWRMRDLEADSPGKKAKRLAKKLAAAPFISRRGLDALTGLERRVSKVLSTTDSYVELYEQIRPSLVFNGSHIHSQRATQAVQAAQWLGVPTAAFVFSWDNLTSQGRIIPLYDYYLVWNEAIRNQLLEIYHQIGSEQVFVTGTPQFDFHSKPAFHWTREEFCEQVGADPSRPIVLYSTGMDNHMEGEPDIVEKIAEMLRRMTDLNRPQLLVRMYGKDRNPGRFDAMRSRCPDVLFPETRWEKSFFTPQPQDSWLLVNALRHAAVGINIASTISLELCMFDRPVINVNYLAHGQRVRFDYRQYYNYEHYKPIVDSGALMLASSEVQMEQQLRLCLTHPAQGSAERQRLIRTMFGSSLDGRAGERVAKILVELAGRAA
ncbi:MAG: hypothetical protein HYV07_09475 [Deltaproteobacteria bacterium]|nr:hypothetical protein [Deltaproteobacteria bacterium]